MKNLRDAEKLAKEMISIGKLAGRETVAVITPMEEPLGKNVGNNLEVIEAVEALKGNKFFFWIFRVYFFLYRKYLRK